ncbi:50S ribosomal protein L22 [Campylobacter sp. MIT 97-5078]|uniref:50S ribosomal protein L22 n=1 Tax=Campylobacter sp. MIT 97-5078 TaxID=1548153 RepID=UPI000513E024|nr:50S ribosomal protein L22 [Campylobacter sp. MIT 97-5078]KGI56198.1 50S ribosomal protein L22 [Campylobacter sp. MIT 97-5078]TQR25550.1 50S ribosomal protein L22 [Campylobacter sp. MIT 97-5078]
MSKALIKYIRLSPTKARLIAKEVQGMNAELALASLQFTPNKGAKYIANAIKTAVANGNFEANEVIVSSCRVDAGSVLKRFRPRARGSASRIRKPTSHILVEVAKQVEKETQKTEAKKTAPKTKTSATVKPKANKAPAKKATAKKED